MLNCVPFDFEAFKWVPLYVSIIERIMIFTTFVLRVPALFFSIAIEWVIIVSKAFLNLSLVAPLVVQYRFVPVVVQVEELVIKRVPIVVIEIKLTCVVRLRRWPD